MILVSITQNKNIHKSFPRNDVHDDDAQSQKQERRIFCVLFSSKKKLCCICGIKTNDTISRSTHIHTRRKQRNQIYILFKTTIVKIIKCVQDVIHFDVYSGGGFFSLSLSHISHAARTKKMQKTQMCEDAHKHLLLNK